MHRLRHTAARLLLLLLFTTALLLPALAQAQGSWAATRGDMAEKRYNHTATLLPDGRVLAVGGEWLPGSAELFDPATGQWRAAGNLSASWPRSHHTATLLHDGRVLVAGGHGGNRPSYLSAELYDSAANTWQATTGALRTDRARHTATLLRDGRVLVLGGVIVDSSTHLRSAEIYDPDSRFWRPAADMSAARTEATATLLPDGRVLVAGGEEGDGGAIDSVEIYDPDSDTWQPAAPLPVPRTRHTATLLPNGRVLVAGGGDRGWGYLATSTVWLYDQVNDRWDTVASLPQAREMHTATLLPDGQVLLAGGRGSGGTSLAAVVLYDPSANQWTQAGSLDTARHRATATLLPSGQVLVAGGTSDGGGSGALAGAELYTLPAATVTPTTMPAGRSQQAAVLLADGGVLVTGGLGAHTSAARLNPATGQWTAAASLPVGRADHTTTLLPDGRVLLAGGQINVNRALAYLYDPVADTWAATSPLPEGRSGHTATLLPDGQVLVAGGWGGQGGSGHCGGYCGSAYLYHPATAQWTATGPMVTPRSRHSATLLADGRVLVAGGSNGSSLASAEIYDPATGQWTATGSMAQPYWRSAALLADGRVLVAGGGGSSSGTGAELYDPATRTWQAAAPLPVAKAYAELATLADGRVLLVGGGNTPAANVIALVYDPAVGAAGQWSQVAANLSAVNNHLRTATLLADGRVLVAGGDDGNGSGYLNVADLIDLRPAAAPARTPQLNAPASPVLRPGTALTFTGARLHGDSEAGGGSRGSSAHNLPLLQLQAVQGGAIRWLKPASSSASGYTAQPLPAAPLPAGWWAARVFVNGIASNPVMLRAPDVPGVPRNLAATPGNGAVVLTWDAPADDGGAPVTGYTVTGASNTCSASPCTVTGLASGTAHAFSVTAANAVGSGPAAQASATPYTTPGAPQNFTATPGDGSVQLAWAAPASNGGNAITGYAVTVDGQPAACAASGCTLTGLANGAAHAFTVRAVTTAGPGPAAQASATPARQRRPQVPLPGGGGDAEVEIGGNPPGCTVTQLAIDTQAPPGAPEGGSFPLGVLHFTAEGCAGATLAVRVTYPQSVAHLRLMKHGPTASDPQPQWFALAGAQLSNGGRTVEFSITDDGEGDSERQASGVIRDPFAPMALAVQPILTLSTWGLLLLGALLGLAGVRRRV